MKKIFRLIAPSVFTASFFAPAFVFAQTGINTSAITPYSNGIINVINGILVPVLMAIAFIVFIWGVFKYFIYNADNEAERTKGKEFVLWGIIGFVVILSVWGLVAIVAQTFGLQSGSGSPTPPTFGTPSGGAQSQGGINNPSAYVAP